MRRTRRLHLALLGASAATAFASLGVQVELLVGPGGLAPADHLLDVAGRQLEGVDRLRLPTLFWLLAPTTTALVGTCAAGVLASLALAIGLAPRLAATVAFVLYLSLQAVGGDFLAYQWDTLLLEALLLAVPWAPSGFWPRIDEEAPPHAALRFVHRWLAFRLMFGSGAAKILSGDPTWRDGTALAHHFETQPLPNPASWWAHQLPPELLQAATWGTLGIELLLPFAFFLGRAPRAIAAGAAITLQLAIVATGSYGFFNLLAVAVMIPVLDDDLWTQRFRRLDDPSWRPRWADRGLTASAVLLFAVATMPFAQRFGAPLPDALRPVTSWAGTLRVTSLYGLFAVMTTERDELAIEGTADGRVWKPYPFRWKPGPVDEPPRVAGPHLPRLDWQMWFAALGRRGPWLHTLVDRLLVGDPLVLEAFTSNPFPEAPPRSIRVVARRYRMTRAEEGTRTGHWWTREPPRVVVPPRSTSRRRGLTAGP